LLFEIPAVIAAGAGSWWFLLPEWFRAELFSKNQRVFSEKTMIRVGVVVGLAATVGVTSFYNITQGAFQLSVPYPKTPHWRGALFFVGWVSAGAGAVLSRRRFGEPAFWSRGNEVTTNLPWTHKRLLRRLGPVMVFFGVYFGTFRTYLVYPALILIVAGVAAYIFGRLLYRANTNQA